MRSLSKSPSNLMIGPYARYANSIGKKLWTALALVHPLLVRTCSLRNVACRINAGARSSLVLAEDSISIGLRAIFQRGLGRRFVLFFAPPSHDAGLLQSLAVGEGQMPRHLG